MLISVVCKTDVPTLAAMVFENAAINFKQIFMNLEKVAMKKKCTLMNLEAIFVIFRLSRLM